MEIGIYIYIWKSDKTSTYGNWKLTLHFRGLLSHLPRAWKVFSYIAIRDIYSENHKVLGL